MTTPFPAVPEQPGYGGQPPYGAPPAYGPPGYGPPPPAYGQPPAYGAPGYGGPPGYGAPGGYGGVRVANPIGIVVALVGGAVALLGAFLDWYSNTQLGDIVNALDVDGAKAFPKAYFGWLMWVLLAATVVAALFANLPGGAAAALRIVSPILGVLGAILLFASLGSLIESGSVFDHSAVGLYLTLLGFLLAGVGGVLGPRRTGAV